MKLIQAWWRTTALHDCVERLRSLGMTCPCWRHRLQTWWEAVKMWWRMR